MTALPSKLCVGLTIALLATGAGGASHWVGCGGQVTTLTVASETLYLVLVQTHAGNQAAGADAALYAESNGRPGLQRGGVALSGDVDPCQQAVDPDVALLLVKHLHLGDVTTDWVAAEAVEPRSDCVEVGADGHVGVGNCGALEALPGV